MALLVQPGEQLVAQTGWQFDLRSAQGKLVVSLMTALAEFERDLLRERVRSGIAAARRRGVVFGRRPRQGRGVKLFYQRLTQSLDGDGCPKLAAIPLIILRL